MDAQQAWNIAYNQLELQFDRASFDTWLRDAKFIKVDGETFIIGVRNSYARDMLQHRLYRNVYRILTDVYGDHVELRFEVMKQQEEKTSEEPDMPLFRYLSQQQVDYRREDVEPDLTPLHEKISRPQLTTLPESELNPRFTFERFIVNSSNHITYEAAQAVAESPAQSYNPLMIYGGVGLGKTHLLQAIAHVCVAKGLNVLYIPSEAFTNDLIDSIRKRQMAMFRERYRSADVLLVDDVQFIAGKDSTQEEFFHTFNALYTFNKQVVLASDRHPRELQTLEDRLRSRFEGGLVTDVQPLEIESRLAILKMWAQERSVLIQSSVLRMVAERASSNVRELEGLFNQMIAKAQLGRGTLTLQGAEHTLERFHRPRQHTRRHEVTLDAVIEATAAYFQLKPQDLTGKRRASRINQARQIAMFIAREVTEASLPQIGETFGRSHTTVLHGCNKIAEEMAFDRPLSEHIQNIKRQFTQ